MVKIVPKNGQHRSQFELKYPTFDVQNSFIFSRISIRTSHFFKSEKFRISTKQQQFKNEGTRIFVDHNIVVGINSDIS